MKNLTYKSARLIDGKIRIIIEDENGNIMNKNPSKEQIDSALLSDNKRRYYNKTNTCDRCSKSLSGRVHREYNKEGNWTGKWLCPTCSYKDYNKYNSDSRDNLSKLLRLHRTGNIDPYSNHGKKLIFETLTCKIRNVKNLNIENDNYISPIDHSADPITGDIIETKGATYDPIGKKWHNGRFGNEHNKNFTILIFYCANEELVDIIRVYEFPKEEVINRTGITIYDNNNSHWYDKYTIDEKIYNNVIHKLTVEDFPQFDRQKLKEWLYKLKR